MIIKDILDMIQINNNVTYKINGIRKPVHVIQYKYKDYICKSLKISTQIESMTMSDLSYDVISTEYSDDELNKIKVETILPNGAYYISIVLDFIIEEE